MYILGGIMKNCYRVEINQRSRYFYDQKKAVDYFLKYIGEKNGELWYMTYTYSESAGHYIATQTLLDYYSAKKVGT